MKFYLDDKEVTLEELEEVRENLDGGECFEEAIELCKIEPDALYFNKTSFEW